MRRASGMKCEIMLRNNKTDCSSWGDHNKVQTCSNKLLLWSISLEHNVGCVPRVSLMSTWISDDTSRKHCSQQGVTHSCHLDHFPRDFWNSIPWLWVGSHPRPKCSIPDRKIWATCNPRGWLWLGWQVLEWALLTKPEILELFLLIDGWSKSYEGYKGAGAFPPFQQNVDHQVPHVKICQKMSKNVNPYPIFTTKNIMWSTSLASTHLFRFSMRRSPRVLSPIPSPSAVGAWNFTDPPE